MRRIILSTVFFLAAFSAWADNELCYIYNDVDYTASVTYPKNKNNTRLHYSGDIVIPDIVTHDNHEYKVTGIGESTFDHNIDVTSVILGKNLKQIDKYAFHKCTGLTEIIIPASVDSIGYRAFMDSGLKDVKFEDSDTPIKIYGSGSYCIFSGSPLQTVYMGRDYISKGRLFRKFETLQDVTFSDNVTEIQDEEFKESRGLRNVNLGANIAKIGNSAFYYCDTLSSITLPESVLTIGSKAFFRCSSLPVINIPSKVKLIEDQTFRYCYALDSISIPANVDSIGLKAFNESGLTIVRIEDSDTPIKLWDQGGFSIFDGSPLKSIYLGRNYISDERPFSGFNTLQNVTVGDIVTELQEREFKLSRGIRNVSLGANITRIGNSAFYKCDTLFSITLPESVLSIGNQAFYNCDTLSIINIQSNVKLIENQAFAYCKNLDSISIPASVDSLGRYVFYESALKKIRFEDSDTPIKLYGSNGGTPFSSSNLESIYLGRDYISEVHPFRSSKTIKELLIGSTLASLPNNAFEKCSNLKTIISYNENPPVCDPNVFTDVNKQSCHLFVPDASITLYASAPTWEEFFPITKVKDTVSKKYSNGTWFDLNGQRMDTYKRGVNLLRTEDGDVIKVNIK